MNTEASLRVKHFPTLDCALNISTSHKEVVMRGHESLYNQISVVKYGSLSLLLLLVLPLISGGLLLGLSIKGGHDAFCQRAAGSD